MNDLLPTPKVAWLASGNGSGKHEITAFDRALKASHVADLNLMRVSSVLPPGCQVKLMLSPIEGNGRLSPAVYSVFKTSTIGEEIACCISVAIPKDPTRSGVFFEISGVMSEVEAIDAAVECARTAMEDRGVKEFAIKTISSSAFHVLEGGHTCVVSLAIFE